MFGVSSVSYVAISGQVVEKIVEEAREHPDEQVVGVLLGGQSGGAIVIEDSATGAAESNSTHATLTGDSIAKIADDIINKRIRGSIVGWYHSHVRGGVFMSDTDVETQLKLQQFSPVVAAMVVDARTGGVGFFRADSKTRGATPVPSRDLSAETAPLVVAPSQAGSAVYPQAPAPAAPMPISTRTILIVVVLLTLAITGGIVALAYYRGPAVYGGSLAVTHTPPKPPLTIGNPITFDANATGTNLQNVTLAYRIIEQAPTPGGVIVGNLVSVPLLAKSAGCTGTCTYSYTMPASEVSGLYIQYYISVYDTASPPNVVRTDVYNISVGDFNWHDDKTETIAIRNVQSSVSLPIDSIHGFNQPVTIKISTSLPLGVRVAPVSTQVRPPSPAVLTITSTDNAQIVRKYDIEVDAVYAVHAVQIIRSTTLELTVTDFDVDVSPTYDKTERCSITASCNDRTEYALYTVTLTIYDGFTSPGGIKIYPSGLPDHTSYELLFVDNKIGTDETQTLTYHLKIRADMSAKVDKYLFSVVVTAGTITHRVDNIQFEIVD